MVKGTCSGDGSGLQKRVTLLEFSCSFINIGIRAYAKKKKKNRKKEIVLKQLSDLKGL